MKARIFVNGASDTSKFVDVPLPVHLSIWPRLLKFETNLYVHIEARQALPGGEPVPEGYWPVKPVSVSREKQVSAKPIVDMAAVEALKAAAAGAFVKVSYRNRGGKQYVTLTGTRGLPHNSVGKFVRKYIPYAYHTSGGGDSHTFRINSDGQMLEHVKNMVEVGLY